MTIDTSLNKTELLEAMDQSWARLQEMVDRLGEERMTGPTDAAGWTGKDHLTHLIAWERSMIWLLQGRPRHEALGVEEALYLARDYDTINEQIRDSMADLTLFQAWGEMTSTRQHLRNLVAEMTDDDLVRPYWSFLAGADGTPGQAPAVQRAAGMDWPVIERIHLNACLHVDEHIGYIEIIAAAPRNRADALDALDGAWADLQEMIDRLGEERLTGPTDAAGWTGKDHLTHLAAWERSMAFLFQGKPRHEGLGIDEATYRSHDIDSINAEIRTTTLHLSLDQALEELDATHRLLRALVADLTDEDLQRTYSHFLPDEPGADDGQPIIGRLDANTRRHYHEHIGYIESIAKDHLFDAMDRSRAIVHAFVDRHGEARLTGPTDAAGWTGKDHIAHCTAWERSLIFHLQGWTRAQGLGVDEAVYETRDYDAINAVIQARTRELTLDEVLTEHDATREQLRAQVASMSGEELGQPYSHYPPEDPAADVPAVYDRILRVVGGHMEAHLGYAEIIATGG